MRLRRSDVTGPGWRRVRHGRGFSYRDAGGEVLADPGVRERLRSLAIPPAWREVWISPYVNGHIQAVGTDEAGRRQYLYHEGWHRQRDLVKHS
ncbi:MAG TPA: DNA topoisomerase IB, partial [Umezawaea sp.]|nr:DNA topoisomerase IB [Umezawaea sp.]